MYVTAQNVYDACLITTSEVPLASVEKFIKAAEREVDRITSTTYWAVSHDALIASASTNNTITVTADTYTASALIGQYVWVYSGTGINQIRKITANTKTEITVDANWTTNPAVADKFRVIYTGTDPKYAESVDGNNEVFFFLPEYPLQIMNSLKIDSVSISQSNIYFYKPIGKIQLKTSAEKTYFSDTYPQSIELDYYFGVYPIPEEVQRYVICLAGASALTAQIGGTFDDPSTYSLPEGSVTVGQAYINIKSGLDLLKAEAEDIEKTKLVKYPKFI